jgi:tetratricopeptide (TPR) repeat protein
VLSDKRFDRRTLVIGAALIAVTLVVFSPAMTHEFLLYDDIDYVSENIAVRAGLSWQGTVWAFTTTHTGNWHPLTWLSHMLDVQLVGLDPHRHHLINLLLHALNSALLFLVLNAMTKGVWPSAFVAALFAIHPLHVESVAWIAERKDVLSTLFWILTMSAYLRYARDPRVSRYVLVLLFFSLGLLAKPMLVTLPAVLLLLDYWPLGRLAASGAVPLRSLLWEKAPLAAIAAVSSGVTFWAQRSGGNVAEVDHVPVGLRLANALVSYATYLEKTVWPRDLAAFYPHPVDLAGGISSWRVVVAGLLVFGITSVVLLAARRHRYAAVGWLWYLGTLIPVIGLVQIGQQAMADRYTYVPLIGIFIVISWGAADVLKGWRSSRVALTIAGGGVVAVLSVLTWCQVHYWRDTITLFEHALAVSPANRVAHLQLGAAYARTGRLDEAVAQYSTALAMKPQSVEANNNLGVVLAQVGRADEAARRFREALTLAPNDARLHANLARAYRQQGVVADAVAHYRDAARLDPDAWQVAYNLAWLLATDDEHGRLSSEAIVLAERADRQTGHAHPNVLDTLAAAYADAGRYQDATDVAQQAVRAALARGQDRLAQEIQARIRLYQAGQPFRVRRGTPS